MTTLLNIALINAVTVLPLALLALLVSRLARRPALTHAVWVLVLLKIVTPPLFHLPVTIETPIASESRSVDVGHVSNVPVPGSDPGPLEHRVAVGDTALPVKRSVSDVTPVVKTEPRRVDRESPSFLTSTLKTCSTFWAGRPGLRPMLLGGWLAGAVLWMTLQIVRAVRFQRRVLRSATPNVELQRQTQQLGAELGLRRVPRVLIVDAAVSPMLWGCGSRAKLLFPTDLEARLNDDARATLLTHELAHFARGDHWVRVLELIATALFWWHPIVWWAKQQIEASEEECCDAWVVSQFPHAPRQYAEALLDTIDFLCESRQALPPVACGLGQAHFLRHRLTKIMRGAAPKALSQRARFVISLVAALLLPLQPFVFGSASAVPLRIKVDPSPLLSRHDSPELGPAETNPRSGETRLLDPALPSILANDNPSVPPARRMKSGERVWSTAASPDGRFVVRATTARRVVLTDCRTKIEMSQGSPT